MIDATFLEKAAALARKPFHFAVAGKNFVAVPQSDGSYRIDDAPSPEVPFGPIRLSTLSGLVDYLKTNRDELEPDDLILHVASPDTVFLTTRQSKDEFRIRQAYVIAQYDPIISRDKGFDFGIFFEVETFTIALQALFVDSPDRAKVLGVLGTVEAGVVETAVDDGITQVVTTRAGIARQGKAIVPNPVELAPWRTFPEITQPVSPFILRMKSEEGERPKAALFEADGGAWELEAIRRIRFHLESVLDGLGIAILA